MLDRCYIGDVRDGLRSFIAAGIRAQTCVSSPPYWGLRDYGTAQWGGGSAECDHLHKTGGTASSTLGLASGGNDMSDEARVRSTARSFVPYSGICGKCGATRIDRQIGLEPTIAEYVATMVDVFRLVRDVLADDGTLWLNLGDSYNAYNGGAGPSSSISAGASTTERPRLETGYGLRSPALKPKDLCGIPWRVAFALQQPYYSGTIKDERDRIWLAAMLDAEGCMFIHKRKAGQHNGQGYHRQNDSYSPGVEISNTSLPVIERIMALVGKGSICSQGPEENGRRKQRLYRWNLRTTECRDFVQELYPYLVAKQHQARILCGCWPSGPTADAAHQALIGLHRGNPTDVDFKPPESLFKPGWYLRSDVVWSKPNPMPESVTDRPTKSHEYLFLLAKSERYFYDAAAIAEPSITPGLKVGGNGKSWHDHQDDLVVGQRSDKDCKLFQAFDNGRNRRTVWTVTTQPFSDAHFAVMPTALVEPCILAGSRTGDVVLDPFMGSGTVAQVAQDLGRRWIGCELNGEYVKMQDRRTAQAGLDLRAAAD